MNVPKHSNLNPNLYTHMPHLPVFLPMPLHTVQICSTPPSRKYLYPQAYTSTYLGNCGP